MKKLIEELNLTIKEFAKMYEIPYNTVRQWYNGTRQAPPYIKKLIEKLTESRNKNKQLEIGENEIYALHIKIENNRVNDEWREFGDLQELGKKKDFYDNQGIFAELELYQKIW